MKAQVTTAEALIIGLRAAIRNPVAALWLYLAVSLASLPVALAAGWIVHDYVGASLSAARFARGLDPVLVGGLLRARSAAIAVLLPLLGGVAVLWLSMSTYLSGATLAAVSRAEASRTNEFFAGGGRAFGRLLRLMFIGVPFVLLAAGLPTYGLWKGVDALTEDWISEKGVFAAKLAAVLGSAVLIAWASGAYDFMRVEAVARGEHRARYAFIRGLTRAARHPLAVLVLATPFAVSAIALTIAASLADAEIARTSWLAIALGFLVQQVVSFARAVLKVGLAGGEVAYVMLTGESSRRPSLSSR